MPLNHYKYYTKITVFNFVILAIATALNGFDRGNPPWKGGLGHSMVDIAGAIATAKNQRKFVYIPPFNGGGNKLMSKATGRTYTFGSEPLCNDTSWIIDRRFSSLSIADRMEAFFENIMPLMNIQECKPDIDLGDMLIHIRSGDIFDFKAHPEKITNKIQSAICASMVQPPIEFYKAIIEKNKTKLKKVTILTEGSCCQSPVIPHLIELLNRYNLQTKLIDNQNFEQDFAAFALAPCIIVHSASAFSSLAGACNYKLTQSTHYFADFAKDITSRFMGLYMTSPRVKKITLVGDFINKLNALKVEYGSLLPLEKVIKLYDPSISAEITHIDP